MWDSASYLHPSKWAQEFAPLSGPDLLFNVAKERRNAAFLDFFGRGFSYAEIDNAVRRFARGLQDMGVQRGDRIGLFLPNVPHYVIAYFGIFAAGATVVNFSPL